MISDHVGLAPAEAPQKNGARGRNDRDVIERACQLLEVTYGIDAVGAADVLRVCAHAVGLDPHVLACRVVRGVGADSTPSHVTVDALLMDVEHPLTDGC